jgi:lysine 2,3-aminomutase
MKFNKMIKNFKFDEVHTVNEQEFNEEEEPPSLEGQYKNHKVKTVKQTSNSPKAVINSGLPSNIPFPLKKYFSGATMKEWSSWEWQVRNSFTSLEEIRKIFSLCEDEISALTDRQGLLPVRITPYFASLISTDNPEQPLRKSVIPIFNEHILSKGEVVDPLGEEKHSPLPNLVHRYPDRVLFLATDFCSTYCRYCTRSRMVGKTCDVAASSTIMWDKAVDYIRQHTEIRDVLISGGDPLTLSDDRLVYLLSKLKEIKHIQMLRIGTKVPVVLPQRINTSLISKLRKFHPLYLSIHFTHPDEITPEVAKACENLADAGIPLGSQTVLLKGINDNIETMMSLMQKLLQIRVRPYYLYQCDPIPGSAHFRTSVEKGLSIMRGLRGFTSGYAVPAYVIDAPGGGGKTPLLPDYFAGIEDDCVLLKNYEGKIFRYYNGKD